MNWDNVYEVPGAWYPNEFVVRFMAKFSRTRTGVDSYRVFRPIGRVLDLGCGSGRHVVMLSREGYDVSGIEVSPRAVEFTRKWLESENLKADVRLGSVTELPWPERSFDLAISEGVLDHMCITDARKAITEARRVLCPGGLFYLSLCSTNESAYGNGTEIEANTFLLSEGRESGTVQRYFDLEDVPWLLEPEFKVLDIVYSEWYPVAGRGFTALEIPSVGKTARWHVAAEVS